VDSARAEYFKRFKEDMFESEARFGQVTNTIDQNNAIERVAIGAHHSDSRTNSILSSNDTVERASEAVVEIAPVIGKSSSGGNETSPAPVLTPRVLCKHAESVGNYMGGTFGAGSGTALGRADANSLNSSPFSPWFISKGLKSITTNLNPLFHIAFS
jgi:hypothetical protein